MTRSKMSPGIPVFSYHRIDRAEFEAQLRYLKENAYTTLAADEYASVYLQKQKIPERAVVLTFDDGLRNLYDVVFPLLKEYGFKAVAFIIPAWVGEKGSITWEQANEMHLAGAVDFQSHTMHHAGINISSRIIDFYYPGFVSHQVWNLPVQAENGKDRYFQPPQLGMPIFEYASRLSDHRRYFPEESFIKACVKFVRENGNEAFFRDKRWRSRLTTLVNDYRKSHSFSGYYEAKEEQEKRIAEELVQSREEIDARITGKSVRHFSFPWNETGKIASRLVKECGYETAYGGLLKTYSSDGYAGKLYYINRLSGDFIFRLSGKGRLSLPGVFISKIKRRLKQGPQY
ncbi:polysaccharide deacetylase family protein [candidate division KSB1 bacterium]|nr:polysaccharide deacetylase family protein [candidate division KSB1 bacterium]